MLGEEQDELDLPDFDPVEYINRRFPDEDSLAGLDACTARFEAEIKALEKELHSAVRGQALAAAKASQDLSDARGSISDLVGKVADIKAKAEKSEDMVQVRRSLRGASRRPHRCTAHCHCTPFARRTSVETSRHWMLRSVISRTPSRRSTACRCW